MNRNMKNKYNTVANEGSTNEVSIYFVRLWYEQALLANSIISVQRTLRAAKRLYPHFVRILYHDIPAKLLPKDLAKQTVRGRSFSR